MKDKLIRLLKAIGIVTLAFGVIVLLCMGLTCYPRLGAGILIGLLFIFAVWRVYEDANL